MSPNSSDYINSNDKDKKKKLMEVYNEYKKGAFPKVQEISVDEVTSRLKNGSKLTLVDTRLKEEQEVSMIRGAITQEEFELNKNQYKDEDIVCYCTIGYRSGKYTQELTDQGFNAYNLEGSILAWIQDGQEIVDQSTGEVVKKVHVFGDQWAYQPDGYEKVAFRWPLLKGLAMLIGQFFK